MIRSKHGKTLWKTFVYKIGKHLTFFSAVPKWFCYLLRVFRLSHRVNSTTIILLPISYDAQCMHCSGVHMLYTLYSSKYTTTCLDRFYDVHKTLRRSRIARKTYHDAFVTDGRIEEIDDDDDNTAPFRWWCPLPFNLGTCRPKCTTCILIILYTCIRVGPSAII